jgi:hypothetical protein
MPLFNLLIWGQIQPAETKSNHHEPTPNYENNLLYEN